jgi:CheY-like chemotaxis protein
MPSKEKKLEERLSELKILIVDDHHHIRKVVRTMLAGMGIRNVQEAPDGAAGLAALPAFDPDIVIVDWDMPLVNGIEFIRLVRTPGASTHADIPIIMLTAHNEYWRVLEAARLGVHEFLIKPVSTKSLRDRITMIVEKPRAMMHIQDSYVPVPRRVVILDDWLTESKRPS